MDAGERRSRGIDEVPLLAAASQRTKRRLADHVERLRLLDGAVVTERGRPVHWIAIATDGMLAGAGRSWAPGEAVFLGEGLLHGLAPGTVVARGDVEVVLIPVRALTAALSTDPGLGLAVARAVAGAPAPPRRHRGFERRRRRPVTTERRVA